MTSSHPLSTRCTAFAGGHLLAVGQLRHVALAAWQAGEADPGTPILIFDDADQRQIEVDLRGSMADLVQRLAALPETGVPDPAADGAATEGEVPAKRPRGRPRLGVVAREVTLLPRHWQWLNAQPGGASVALRKLVEAARRDHGDDDRRREGQEAAYRFIHAVAGDAPGFEEAARALFAGDLGRFEDMVARWPQDVRDHATMLAGRALAQ
jgi:hypothetical protein